MIDDLQIIEAATRAQRIKEAMPKLGVSTDALFTAIVLGKHRPGRPVLRLKPEIPNDPPAWFTEGLQYCAGRSITIGRFLFLIGRHGANKAERNAVGRWLRASGRKPRKTGGEQLFDI